MRPFIIKSSLSLSTALIALSLGACTTKLNLEAPYDDLTFEKALPEADPPKPVEIVEIPKVLPLPGQLKPLPGKVVREEKLPPEQAIALPAASLAIWPNAASTSVLATLTAACCPALSSMGR